MLFFDDFVHENKQNQIFNIKSKETISPPELDVTMIDFDLRINKVITKKKVGQVIIF